MSLNEERGVINESEDAVGISNSMIILNKESQSTSKAAILLNSKENA